MARWTVLAFAAAAALVVGAVSSSLFLMLTSDQSDGGFQQGTALNGDPAPDFRLLDQSGRSVALSDFRGKPVLLTFLYTRCQDICPLTAGKIRQTLQELKDAAHNVAVLAVSVDPNGDDQQAAYEFSARHGLLAYDWHYLLSSEAELTQVWRAYGIGQDHAPTAGLGPPRQAVLHTDALYVIDAQGRKRVLLRSDFDPALLAKDLRRLMK